MRSAVVLTLSTCLVCACAVGSSRPSNRAILAEAPATRPPSTSTRLLPEATPSARPLPPTEPPLPRAYHSSLDGALLLLVPAGDFIMGSLQNDWGAAPDEWPQHTIYLPDFWIDETEVTNAQYAKCVEAGACAPPSSPYSHRRARYYGVPEFDNYPVTFTSLADAIAFCTWARRRLPTEAEWEKAARGVDGRLFPWGDAFPYCDDANVIGCDGDTWEVGSNPSGASPYGAMDMAGNVWERVADLYEANYYAASLFENPLGPTSGMQGLMRGGAFDRFVENARCPNREVGQGGGSNVGFRCAVSPP